MNLIAKVHVCTSLEPSPACDRVLQVPDQACGFPVALQNVHICDVVMAGDSTQQVFKLDITSSDMCTSF